MITYRILNLQLTGATQQTRELGQEPTLAELLQKGIITHSLTEC